jgi:hypothetical protein
LRSSTTRQALLVIVATALLANGLLLVNDGVFWDAWIYHTNLLDGRPDLVLAAHLEAGVPMRGLYQVALGSLGVDPSLLNRVVGFLAILGGGLLTYRLALRERVMSDGEALFVASFVVAYPALETAVSDVVVPLILSQTLVLAAVWISCEAQRYTGIAHASMRALTVVTLVLAFEHKAMLAFFLGLVPLAVLAAAKRYPFKVAIARLVSQRAELIAVPFVYYAAASALLPQRGFYAGEYSIGEFARMPRIAGRFAVVTLDQLSEALHAVQRWPLAALVLIGLPSFLRSVPRQRIGDRHAFLLLGAALLWLLAATLPYILINRSPAVRGWEARHLLPVATPLAIALVAASRPIRDRLRGHAHHAARLLAAALVVGLLMFQVSEHASWLGRWAKDRATIAALAERPELRAYSVFFVVDEDRIGGSYYYEFYEWAGIFEAAWGSQRWYGTDGIDPGALERDRKYFGAFYLLSEADVDGCRAELMVRRARPGLDAIDLGFMYALRRFGGDESGVLDGLEAVEAIPQSAPPSRVCP